jgi:lipopolysaccharide biosynthesis regulator YciM
MAPRWLRWRSPRRAPDVPRAIRQALVATLDRDLERAEALLADVVRRDSTELDAYLALARLYRQRGEIGRAIHIHQNLLLRSDATREARFQALRGLADDFREGGFLRRAIAAYQEVLAEQADDAGALRALVALLADAGEMRQAMPLARRLARVDGREPRGVEATLWVAFAETERAEGRPDAARRALKKALRRDPQGVRAWILLGELEAERGRSRKALAAWGRVPDLDRRAGPAVYPRLAATFAALGRPRDHEVFLRGLIDTQPDDVEARLALARALAARGAVDEAVAEARAALERDPDALTVHLALGRLLISEGRNEEAGKAHQELLDVLERRRDLLLASRPTRDEADPFA